MVSAVDIFMVQTANPTGAFTVTETCRAHRDDKAKRERQAAAAAE